MIESNHRWSNHSIGNELYHKFGFNLLKGICFTFWSNYSICRKNTYQGILSLGIRESLYSLQYRFLHLILPQASLLYWFLCQVHIQQSRYQLSNYPIYNESLKKNQNRIVFKIFLNKSFYSWFTTKWIVPGHVSQELGHLVWMNGEQQSIAASISGHHASRSSQSPLEQQDFTIT